MITFAVWEKRSMEILDKIKRRYERIKLDKQEREEKAEFLRALEQARFDVQNARNNYDFVQDKSLLEYYIYEIKAAETRLNYYLRLAKQEKICNDAYLPGVFLQNERRSERI